MNTRKLNLSSDELRSLFLVDGLRREEIAARYGVCEQTVQNWLSRYNIRLRKERRKPRLPEEAIRELYVDKNFTIKEIAKRYGKSKSSVREAVIEYGLQLNRREVEDRKVARNKPGYRHRTKTSGYWRVIAREHPSANQDGYVAEHRLVMEQAIGRYLTTGEQVHHLDFDKGNNEILNLMMLPSMRDHARMHKYTERVGAYMVGRLKTRPESLKFDDPVFFEGRWASEIDLIGGREPVNDLGRVRLGAAA